MPNPQRLSVLLLVSVAAAVSVGQRVGIAAPVLVAAYNFNQASGTTLTDVSGNGNAGTLVNGPVWTTAGKFGGALTFDGVNDLVTIASAPSLAVSSGMTVEAWVKPRALSGYRTIVLKERPAQLSYSLYASVNANRPAVEIATPGNPDARGNAQLPLNAWTHLAGTYNGSVLSLYVNGALVASKSTSGPIPSSTNPLRIGGNLVWGEYFNGFIDDVRIYDGPLSQAQIQADMMTPLPDAGPPDTIPPTVSMSAPADGAAVSGTVTLSALASDNVGVAGVQFLLNGGALGAEDSTGPYSIAWNTATLANGTYAISATARDIAANTATSGAISVTVNNPPKLTVTQPAPNAVITGSVVDVAYAVAGDSSQVTGADFQLDGGALAADTPVDGIYQLTDVGPGAHVLNGFLVSAQGKIAGSDATPVSFTTRVPDTIPPAVSITSPSDASTVSGTITVAADASDNVGVSAVQFLLDAVNLDAADTNAPFAVSWTTSTAMNGTHILTAVAFDAAGNQTPSQSIAVTVSNTNPAAILGQWAATMDWPVVAVHASLLPTRQVLVWEGYDGPNSQSRLWDPATNIIRTFSAPGDLFCSGHSLLPDGRLLVTGGFGGGETGTHETNIFDPFTTTWTRVADMNTQRWYPSNIPLADGKVVALSGQITSSVWADTPEIFDPKPATWTNLTGVSTSDVHDHEYALTFGLPNGKVFVLAASTGVVRRFDPIARTWTAAPTDPKVTWSSAVMYRPGKILVSGGGNKSQSLNAQTSALVIDETAATPAWRAILPMQNPRYQHNLLMLPDGTVLAVGGSTTLDQSSHSGTLVAEIWDPVTERWFAMASMRDPRMYHSTALLLPDGRVLSAGGGREGSGTNYLTAQIYSPPYLFKGARPTISDAPQLAQYGSTITVTTPDAANISKVTLISLTSTTHTLDANQRFIELPFTRNNGALDVTMPANGNLAPPTYYMLFVVNNQGVPSTAAMIRLPAPGEDNQAPTAPSNLTASTSGHTVGLSWTAAIDNVGVTNYNVYRGVTAGFTPGVSNLIGQGAATTYSDAAISGTVYYKVTAQDLAGNTSAPSNEAIAVLPDDVVAPAVSMTFPADGSTVNSTVAVSAQASDDVGVAGVQFLVDGNNLGAEDTAAPFSVPWDTTTATNASHRLSARARDARGNTTVSSEISVSVNNTALFTIDFNNLTTVQAPLNGQYPTGVVNWGTNIWWLSSPWGQFTTNSISFNGSGPTSGTFSFASARVLVSLKAFNGGTAASTVTLSCTGNTSQTVSVAVNQLATIATGWTTPCTTVTVTSSNGWNTNFDDLMYR